MSGEAGIRSLGDCVQRYSVGLRVSGLESDREAGGDSRERGRSLSLQPLACQSVLVLHTFTCI